MGILRIHLKIYSPECRPSFKPDHLAGITYEGNSRAKTVSALK